MTKVLGITFAVLGMTGVALAADNSLGTWKYNASKSEQPAGVLSPIKNLTQTREAVNGGVKTSVKGERADGSKIDVTTISKYDGKEVPVPGTGTPWDTVASLLSQ